MWSSGHRAPTITVRILLKFTVYNLQKYIRKEWKTVIYSKKFINTLLSIKYTQPRPLFAHTMNVKKLDVRGTRTQISFIKDIKMCPNLHHSTKHWDSFSLKKNFAKNVDNLENESRDLLISRCDMSDDPLEKMMRAKKYFFPFYTSPILPKRPAAWDRIRIP